MVLHCVGLYHDVALRASDFYRRQEMTRNQIIELVNAFNYIGNTARRLGRTDLKAYAYFSEVHAKELGTGIFYTKDLSNPLGEGSEPVEISVNELVIGVNMSAYQQMRAIEQILDITKEQQ